jgi:hypothetical protein
MANREVRTGTTRAVLGLGTLGELAPDPQVQRVPHCNQFQDSLDRLGWAVLRLLPESDNQEDKDCQNKRTNPELCSRRPFQAGDGRTEDVGLYVGRDQVGELVADAPVPGAEGGPTMSVV